MNFRKKGTKRELISQVPSYNVSIEKDLLKTCLSWVFFYAFLINLKEAIYMLLEEYTLENTKIKFYDDYIVENISNQKEYIDNVIINLIRKINTSLL